MSPVNLNNLTQLTETVLNEIAAFSQHNPYRMLLVSLIPVFSLVLGATLDPEGWANSVLYGVVDVLALFWFSTPEEVKINNLIAAAAPTIGYGVIIDTIQLLTPIFFVFLAVKLYKLLPFV